MSQLSIAKRTQGNVVILDVVGRFTLGEETLKFRDSVAAVIDGGGKKILANLFGVVYLDSSGLGELVGAQAMAQRNGAVLKLVNAPRRVLSLLNLTKIITIFETFEFETDGVRSFASNRPPARMTGAVL